MGTVFDLVYVFTDYQALAIVSFWNIAVGSGLALLAALFGVLDWTAIPRRTRAKRIGTVHGLGNVIMVAFFVGALLVRMGEPRLLPTTVAIVLELAGLALAMLTGWLGGELVSRLGVGVSDGANLNAPSSLGRPGARAEAGAGAE
jgi:uncharacterized membrane protein